MKEAEINFEREEMSGIVPVGSYVADVSRRFGVRFAEPCDWGAGEHHCEVEITEGADLLSPITSAEAKYFEEREAGHAARLACQARIENEGEITVVTKETEAEKEQKIETEEEYRKRFAEMPLNEKMSELVQLEAMALSDTLSFVANAPYTIGDKIMALMADLGLKKETREREAVRPEEHRAAETETAPAAEEEKGT